MNTPTTPPTSDVPQDPDIHDVPATADPAPDDALADEVFVDDDATRSLPTTPSATSAAGTVGATGATTATVTATPEAPEQEWLKGPAPFALVLGLLGLVVAGATLLSELADVNVPWDDLGPWSVVAAGIVVLLVGAIGLRSSRARH
jgi:hypothetical protein